MEKENERREEYALVLDFLSTGKSFSSRSEPIAQLIGEEWFTLLEATPKPGSQLTTGERVYIGKDERDKIALIKFRISYSELTQTAKGNLKGIILTIIKANPQRFVSFFNNSGPLNIREHSLELLPGIGKKHLQTILKARSEKKFESFEDITSRIALLQDPAEMIAQRIVQELQGTERFYIFTKPYFKRQEQQRRY
jgi:putative nucleotide binding protein